MGALLFLSGYLGQFESLTAIRARWTVRALHPEVRRRFVRLMVHAKRSGVDVGIGEGARSTAVQRAGFYARHYAVPSGGCCSYGGQRYQVRPGVAHMSPPGAGCHEDEATSRGAVAIDAVGDRVWADFMAAGFGLKTFRNVNSEIWHHQPIEQPNARADWSLLAVTVWPTSAQKYRRPGSKKAGPKFPPLPKRSVSAARSYASARAHRPDHKTVCTS